MRIDRRLQFRLDSACPGGGEACECGSGGCLLSDGEECSRALDCASGQCTATEVGQNICCAAPCDSDEVCREDGSACELAPVCDNGDVRCSGSNYQQCVDGQWQTQVDCGTLGCSVPLDGCRREAGEPCDSSTDCGEGSCRDSASAGSVCCTASCDTACKICTDSGLTCQNLNDDDACGTIPCPANTPCRDYPSYAENRCYLGNCGTGDQLCSFTAINEGQTCDAGLRCDSNGNCNVPKLNLGMGCTQNVECNSNFCVDGRCCAEGCGDVCETCNSSGQCVATSDDDVCPNVDCPSDTTCRDYSADITANLCRSRGQCKTTSDCTWTAETNGTFCGDPDVAAEHMTCQDGTCAYPGVACGSVNDCHTNYCCNDYSAEPNALTCQNPGSTCDVDAYSGMWLRCDEPDDCAPGYICCYQSYNGIRIYCHATCSGSAGSPVGYYVVCLTNADCPSGETCESTSTPGVRRCVS